MSINKNLKVLVLPSWYPNKLSRFDGDFIQRHIRAISAFCRQDVIYVMKDEKGVITRNVTIEENNVGPLTEKIIYYRPVKTGIGILDKFLSQQKYNRVYRKAIRKYITENGVPRLLHIHVAMKAGLVALWIKKKWNIPFILSEHWTGYLDNSDLRLEHFSFIYRNWLKEVMVAAATITVVSEYLGKAIQKHFGQITYHVIPNVVDTEIFFPSENQKTPITRFIHVSNMNYQKNTGAILQALSLLSKRDPEFIMNLYGPIHASIQELIVNLGLTGNVFLKGELPQHEFGKEMQVSDALILYSRFETFGCVIIEANACGVPVIVSDLEVFHELISENVNGIFVKNDDPEELAKHMHDFMLQKNTFSKATIAATTTKYHYNNVGRQFAELYYNFT